MPCKITITVRSAETMCDGQHAYYFLIAWGDLRETVQLCTNCTIILISKASECVRLQSRGPCSMDRCPDTCRKPD